jgi:hypothetical protein
MHTPGVPIRLADPNAPVYNESQWRNIQNLVANTEFTPLEIKAFYVLGLIFEICESVDCLLKAPAPSRHDHPVADQVSTSGGRLLPAFGIFASGIELMGRCLTGSETVDLNENLRVGFHYLAKPSKLPLLKNIPVDRVVFITSRPYSVQDLIDLRNYAAHGQSTVGEKDPSGKRLVPKGNLPGIERELFTQLPDKTAQAVAEYWTWLLNDADHCTRLAKASDPMPKFCNE